MSIKKGILDTSYFSKIKIIWGLIFVLIIFLGGLNFYQSPGSAELVFGRTEKNYWFILHRKSNKEFLFFGTPGRVADSALVKIFKVKSGIPGERPTPLPKLLEREYWVITDKFDSSTYPETAPYFLSLSVPVSEQFPYGPEPYFECNGQCNWELPGSFGLHGVNKDLSRLEADNPGSSGCVRHSDEDITYLYNLLDPSSGEIRYYIDDV